MYFQMSKNVLEQYVSIKKEIADLEKRIAECNKKLRQLEKEIVCDVVKGSRADLSYGSIKVEGIATSEIDWHWNLIHERTARLQIFKKRLEEMKVDIESFIESINDSETRRIARFRFLDDYSWIEVARLMGYGWTDDSCRKRCNRYLKQHGAA